MYTLRNIFITRDYAGSHDAVVIGGFPHASSEPPFC